MAVTIKDVARLAGVSHQTVSRVINNSPNIAPETYEKVMDAIQKLNYFPNSLARNLQREIVNAIGLTIPFSSHEIANNAFFAQIIGEVSGICTKRGIHLNVFSFDEHSEDAGMIIRLYKEKIISGVLLTCPGLDSNSIMSLIYNKVPFVVVGRPNLDFGVSYADIDNEDIACRATLSLLELGHRRIALINGPEFMTYSDDLRNGYRRALDRFNMPPESTFVRNTNLIFADSRPSEFDFIFDNGITAVICANDSLALGVMGLLKASGRRIPADVSLMALTYNAWYSHLTPSLAGTDMHSSQLGMEATNMLLSLIFDKPNEPMRLILKADLIPGSSIGLVKP
jgi:LacI family transcriptional regulator